MSTKLNAASIEALKEYRNSFTSSKDGRTNAVEAWNASHDFTAGMTVPVLRDALMLMRILRTQIGQTDEWPIQIKCGDEAIRTV